MAIGYGGGIFLPSESAYKDPNRFRDVLAAEAVKEANYLSQMDQFYAELEETKRQFDITSEQRERFFEEEMAFGREKLEFTGEQAELDRALKRYEIGETTSTQKYVAGLQAETQRGVAEMGYATDLAKLSLEKEAQAENVSYNQFIKDLYLRKESRTQGAYDLYSGVVGGSKSSTPTSIQPFEGNYYSPFSGQSISDFLDVESYY